MVHSRIQAAASDEDKLIAQHLKAAARRIESAMKVARRAPRNYRSRRVMRDLSGLLSAVTRIQAISSRNGRDDPDLIPEEDRVRRFREAIREVRDE